jgi:hypothetical protein
MSDFKITFEAVGPTLPELSAAPGEAFMVFRVAGATEEVTHRAAAVFSELSKAMSDGVFRVEEAVPVIAAALGSESVAARLVVALVPALMDALDDGRITLSEAFRVVMSVVDAL